MLCKQYPNMNQKCVLITTFSFSFFANCLQLYVCIVVLRLRGTGPFTQDSLLMQSEGGRIRCSHYKTCLRRECSRYTILAVRRRNQLCWHGKYMAAAHDPPVIKNINSPTNCHVHSSGIQMLFFIFMVHFLTDSTPVEFIV